MAGYEKLLDSDDTGENTAPPAADTGQEQEAQDSPESVSPEKTVPLRALEDERSKRQSYEAMVQAQQRQIDAMIQALQANQGGRTAPPALPLPDLLLEPDKWQHNLFGAVENMVSQQLVQTKIALAEDIMRETKPDYDDMIDRYVKPALERDPALRQQVMSAPNPAKAAYKYAKRMQAEESLGGELDPEKLKEKLRAEVKAEIMAELQQKAGELEEKVKIPVSLGKVGTSAPTQTEKIPDGGQWRARDLY